MLVTTIELWPLGNVAKARTLVVIAIVNDGSGDRNVGNYRYYVSHQLDQPLYEREHFDGVVKMVTEGKGVWKQGTVAGFKRLDGAAKLLGRVMKQARLT